MGKFKVRLKITGLEFEVEGSRDEVPVITQSLGRQFGGLIGPGAEIAKMEEILAPSANGSATPAQTVTKKASKSKSRASKEEKNQALDWVHDPSQWGMPQQDWSNLEKAIWLLYVAEKAGVAKDMTPKQITATFEKHFRQAKPISYKNIYRDLGNAKLDGLVGQDTTKDPSTWYLIEKGIKEAEKLVVKGRAPETTVNGTS